MGGYWERKQSIVWATPELIDLVADLVDISGRAVPSVDEIILRDADKQPIFFAETDEIRTWRDEMIQINSAASALDM